MRQIQLEEAKDDPWRLDNFDLVNLPARHGDHISKMGDLQRTRIAVSMWRDYLHNLGLN